MIEQARGLFDIAFPGQRFEPATRITGFSAIVGNDLKLIGQRIQAPLADQRMIEESKPPGASMSNGVPLPVT